MQLSLSPSQAKRPLLNSFDDPRVNTSTAKKVKTTPKSQVDVEEFDGPITRFLPPNKDEAFIAFMPDSAQVSEQYVYLLGSQHIC